MSVLTPQLTSQIETSIGLKGSEKRGAKRQLTPPQQPSLLQAIVESFIDGVLILSETGEWIHANDCARRLCRQLIKGQVSAQTVPPSIWRVCESLIDSHEWFSDRKMILESEIDATEGADLRVRVRWLELEEGDRHYILVTLEDRQQLAQKAAIADASKYDLTPREAEVWSLKLAHYSYKEIAAKLHITNNTVKKHMKNIYAKQQVFEWEQQERQARSFN
jgi:DNA-binding CsgD family transcriptional regulator